MIATMGPVEKSFIFGLSLGLVASVLRRCAVDLELFGESGGERLLELIELVDEVEDGGFGAKNLFLLLVQGLALGDDLFHGEGRGCGSASSLGDRVYVGSKMRTIEECDRA